MVFITRVLRLRIPSPNHQARCICAGIRVRVYRLRVVAKSAVPEIPVVVLVGRIAAAEVRYMPVHRYLETGVQIIAWRTTTTDHDCFAMVFVTRVLRLRIPSPNHQASGIGAGRTVGMRWFGRIA